MLRSLMKDDNSEREVNHHGTSILQYINWPRVKQSERKKRINDKDIKHSSVSI